MVWYAQYVKVYVYIYIYTYSCTYMCDMYCSKCLFCLRYLEFLCIAKMEDQERIVRIRASLMLKLSTETVLFTLIRMMFFISPDFHAPLPPFGPEWGWCAGPLNPKTPNPETLNLKP